MLDTTMPSMLPLVTDQTDDDTTISANSAPVLTIPHSMSETEEHSLSFKPPSTSISNSSFIDSEQPTELAISSVASSLPNDNATTSVLDSAIPIHPMVTPAKVGINKPNPKYVEHNKLHSIPKEPKSIRYSLKLEG
ncbi:unnamed protein product [Ilex paraguariensis]|uniref:Uncharacterized protein n=1 Tax=Ilex paraguariensis TaxID=185542 RepID=A0ABC8TCR3_9AQUA